MKSFCSEKRLCCRVAVGCRDAVIGKINFFDESYTEGSILCVRGGEECDFSQLLFCPPLAVVILNCAKSSSIGLFCSLGVPCILLEEGELSDGAFKNRVALIDTERGIITFDPSIETLNFYSKDFRREGGFSRFGCEKGRFLEMLSDSNLKNDEATVENYLIPSRLLLNGEDIFDSALSLWERLSPELITVELSVGKNENEEKLFSEIVEQLFRASVYGGFAISVCGFDCDDLLLKSQRAIHKAFCLLEGEGREFNGYIPRGITISSPIRVMSELPIANPDFIILDIDSILPALFCLSPEEIIKKEKALKKELFSLLERYFSRFAPKCDFFIKTKLFVGSSFLCELIELANIKIVFC